MSGPLKVVQRSNDPTIPTIMVCEYCGAKGHYPEHKHNCIHAHAEVHILNID